MSANIIPHDANLFDFSTVDFSTGFFDNRNVFLTDTAKGNQSALSLQSQKLQFSQYLQSATSLGPTLLSQHNSSLTDYFINQAGEKHKPTLKIIFDEFNYDLRTRHNILKIVVETYFKDVVENRKCQNIKSLYSKAGSKALTMLDQIHQALESPDKKPQHLALSYYKMGIGKHAIMGVVRSILAFDRNNVIHTYNRAKINANIPYRTFERHWYGSFNKYWNTFIELCKPTKLDDNESERTTKNGAFHLIDTRILEYDKPPDIPTQPVEPALTECFKSLTQDEIADLCQQLVDTIPVSKRHPYSDPTITNDRKFLINGTIPSGIDPRTFLFEFFKGYIQALRNEQ